MLMSGLSLVGSDMNIKSKRLGSGIIVIIIIVIVVVVVVVVVVSMMIIIIIIVVIVIVVVVVELNMGQACFKTQVDMFVNLNNRMDLTRLSNSRRLGLAWLYDTINIFLKKY
jgi:cobalamin biosynthesis protein CobD/CbiB